MFDWVYLVIVIVVVFVSMVLHELMHGLTAYWLGDDTAKEYGRLTLNPIKHIDPIMTIALPLFLAVMGGPIFGGAKPVPFNPHKVRYGEWGAALVAIAGPLTNLLIAFVVFGVGVLSGVITSAGVEATLAGQIIITAVSVNLGFFVFNILPIPPLDGSRVLYALAPDPVKAGMEYIERYGIFLVFGLVLIGASVLGQIMAGGINGILQLFMTIFRV